ncbi:hypothetical protein GCM10028810_54300 [Spirosoma litoris]
MPSKAQDRSELFLIYGNIPNVTQSLAIWPSYDNATVVKGPENQLFNFAKAIGYREVRHEGTILKNPENGTVPLKLYLKVTERGSPHDFFSTATNEGEQSAIAAQYKFIGILGYVFPRQVEGTVPLKLYYSDQRGDNFVLVTKEGEASAIAAKYRYVRVEGYVYP